MSDEVWKGSAAPAWLGEPLLRPGERVVLWRGPRDGRLAGWLRGRIGRLIVNGRMGLLLLANIAAIPAFPLAGMGLGMLLGGGDGWAGLRLGLTLAFGCNAAALAAFFWVFNDVFHVLTDRRLLVIKGYEPVQAFDLDLLRRLLSAADAARPAGAPADEHVLEPGKLRAPAARPAGGVTELDPILRMLREFGQLQAPAGK
jgi:hypothetical protein